jgi:hypothetical protein
LRIIYYFHAAPNKVIFVAMYAKSERENLTDADKRQIQKYVAEITNPTRTG